MPPPQQQTQQQQQQQQPGAGSLAQQTMGSPSYQAPWGSLEQQQGFGSVGVGGNPFNIVQTGGFGIMPQSASPLSQAMQGKASADRWSSLRTVGGGDPGRYQEQLAGMANVQRQGEMEQQQRSMFGTQLEAANLRNQLFKKLMGLFGGGMLGGQGGFGGVPMPVQADPQILAAQQAKVTEEFGRPGGLQSQLQRLGASQNRYSADSGLAASRQASLDRARSGAMTEAYLPAQQATVMGYQPGLKGQEIALQAAQFMPKLLVDLFGKMMG